MVDCKLNKNLEVGNHISFILGSKLIDGYIKEKTNMGKGDIDFLIETESGDLCRVKHRNLDLYYIYEK